MTSPTEEQPLRERQIRPRRITKQEGRLYSAKQLRGKVSKNTTFEYLRAYGKSSAFLKLARDDDPTPIGKYSSIATSGRFESVSYGTRKRNPLQGKDTLISSDKENEQFGRQKINFCFGNKRFRLLVWLRDME